MATVTKDFRIKSGLVVEGANATVDGSDIITEDIITGGTQTNIAVTYDAQNKVLNFVAENGVADSTTDDLAEGTTQLYFTDERAQDAIASAISSGTQSGISVTYDDVTNSFDFNVNDPTITIDGDVDGSATVTNLGNTTITVALDTVNSNVGSFGSTTKIPTFTVNGKGLVTAAGEVDVATNLSIAGDTGTDTVSLLSDTLTITGGTGIDTSVTDNEITISVDTDVIATKTYVDSVAQGLDVKESVKTATTQDENLSTYPVAGDFMDGVLLAAGDRVLIKSQADAALNGIYVVNEASAPTRAADADQPDELNAGTFVFVEQGSVNADTGWVVSSDNPLVIGTDAMVWTQFSGAGTYTAGYGLTLTGTEFAVDNTEIVNQQNLTDAVTDLTTYIDGFLDASTGTTVEYIDDQDAATLLAATEYTNTLVAAGDAAATPTYLALDINSLATQVAAQVSAPDAGTPVVAYAFDKSASRTAKFLVKVAYSTHTEVSEVLLTLDTSDNIAITEYAVVSTNGSSSAISAGINGTDVELLVTPVNANSTVTLMGTLIA